MYLEQVFTQILKMSMTAGWCILAVLALHLIFHKAPKKYLYASVAGGGFPADLSGFY